MRCAPPMTSSNPFLQGVSEDDLSAALEGASSNPFLAGADLPDDSPDPARAHELDLGEAASITFTVNGTMGHRTSTFTGVVEDITDFNIVLRDGQSVLCYVPRMCIDRVA